MGHLRETNWSIMVQSSVSESEVHTVYVPNKRMESNG